MYPIIIKKANAPSIVDEVKLIADEHRSELGFHPRQAYVDSLTKRELLVAKTGGRVVGFVRYHHRQDKRTTLYEIVTVPKFRNQGVGRSLVDALILDCQNVGSRCVCLSCPAELPANRFYEAIGFTRSTRHSRKGKKRPLYQWELPILQRREIMFVASLTASGSDLEKLIKMREAEGPSEKPFEKCIITPLFIGPKALKCVRYIHENWGVDVIFDSGGFFVQQGKISYDELFVQLLDFYLKNEWADTYVLPDFVPTSRLSSDEIAERVYVTAAESVRFLDRLPAYLRSRALGVLQGHRPKHLKYCFEAYLDSGLQRIGFGSFDTTGVKAEINLLTSRAARRLDFVRGLIYRNFLNGKIESTLDFHLFGVSSPNIIEQSRGYLATSFDSSGWQRTAGYGNVYLPFQGRRNVSHGSSALMNSGGMSASEFHAHCERTHHSCPFCRDFSKIQNDRLARMWHNAIVFGEMTNIVNKRPERR